MLLFKKYQRILDIINKWSKSIFYLTSVYVGNHERFYALRITIVLKMQEIVIPEAG